MYTHIFQDLRAEISSMQSEHDQARAHDHDQLQGLRHEVQCLQQRVIDEKEKHGTLQGEWSDRTQQHHKEIANMVGTAQYQ